MNLGDLITQRSIKVLQLKMQTLAKWQADIATVRGAYYAYDQAQHMLDDCTTFEYQCQSPKYAIGFELVLR